jgi:hypothetical protein
VVVDSPAADVQPVQLDRLDSDNTTVLPPISRAIGVGAARSLRWRNTLPIPVTSQSVRIRSGSCTTGCGPSDTYRVRFYETTSSIPRFSNAGSQMTVVTLLASSDFGLAAKQTLVLDTTSVAALVGASGTVTISHDGRYGDLVGKAVALEAASGFSFDSLMLWRPVR